MYKVMIVDDESLIVSLIQKLIDWEKYNMVVAGTANNGIDALAAVAQIQPDIIILDVRMPGYDGITFMQKLREINTHIKFIVISGHKKFEYAKSAMKYNVEDYLIKPINKEELEHILDKLSHTFANEQKSEQMHKIMSNELVSKNQQLLDLFITDFFNGKLSETKLSENYINNFYSTNFKHGSYSCVILKLDSRHTQLDPVFTDKLLTRIRDLFYKIMSPVCYETLIHVTCDALNIICNYSEDKHKQFLNSIKEIYSGAADILEKFEDILLTIGIGKTVTQLAETSLCLESTFKTIQARIALGTDRIILHSDLKEDTGILKIILTNTALEKWDEALRSLQIDKIKIQVLNFYSMADSYRYQDNLIYFKITMALHKAFYDYISKIDLCKSTYTEFESELKEKMCWAYTSRLLAESITEQMGLYISQYSNDDVHELNPAIRIAKKYIAENYKSNISMASMAQLVNLSPVYFSVLFKREVGTNFLDYLNQYRLEISKKLLKHVKYNINEVASLSGFQDSKYFSKLFKKTYGITPTDYRNRNAG